MSDQEALKSAWDKFLDSKDYVSHSLISGNLEEALTWTLQMRKDLNWLIELLDQEVKS